VCFGLAKKSARFEGAECVFSLNPSVQVKSLIGFNKILFTFGHQQYVAALQIIIWS